MFIFLLFAKMCFHCAMNCGSSEEVDSINFVGMQLIPLFHCFDAYGYFANITTFHPITFNVRTSQSWPIEKIIGIFQLG